MYKYLTPVSVPHLISPRVPGSPALTGAVMGPVLATLKPLVIPILLPVIFTSLPTPFGCMLTFCPVAGKITSPEPALEVIESTVSSPDDKMSTLPVIDTDVPPPITPKLFVAIPPVKVERFCTERVPGAPGAFPIPTAAVLGTVTPPLKVAMTVNAVSTFNDEVTIDNQLAVTSLSELSNVEITGSLLQSGGIVTLAGPNVTVNTSLTVNGGLLQANAGLEVNNVLLTANAGLTVVGTSTLATTNIATLTVAGTSALIGQVTVTNNLILLPTSTLEIQNTNFNAFGVGTPGLPNAVQVSGGVGIGATLWVTQGIRSNGNINTTGNITASLNIKGSFIESTGNLLVGATLNTSTLNVTTGTTTLGGDLTVTDMATFNGGVTVPNTAAVGIGNAPGAPGTLSVQNLSTFTGGIATNSLGVIGGGTSVSITGNVDILSSGELTVDSITSNAGSGLVILPATGQNVNIQPNGVGSEVNITGSNIGITSGFKVANTGPMTAPVNAGDPGTLGDIRWGTDTGVRYLYICIAANTWERVALAPW